MAIISLIAAVDESYGLGLNNQLLCHLPADLKHFKTITMGKPIVMGKNTYTSIGKPLPGRRNIILSRGNLIVEGAEVINSLEAALNLLKAEPEVMIIGGETVFKEALSLATRIYLTLIHHQFEADVYFPQFDRLEWHCIDKREITHDDKNRYDMTFFLYERS